MADSEPVLVLIVTMLVLGLTFIAFNAVQASIWLLNRFKAEVKTIHSGDESKVTIQIDKVGFSDTISLVGALISLALLLGQASPWLTVAVASALIWLNGRLVIRHKVRKIQDLSRA